MLLWKESSSFYPYSFCFLPAEAQRHLTENQPLQKQIALSNKHKHFLVPGINLVALHVKEWTVLVLFMSPFKKKILSFLEFLGIWLPRGNLSKKEVLKKGIWYFSEPIKTVKKSIMWVLWPQLKMEKFSLFMPPLHVESWPPLWKTLIGRACMFKLDEWFKIAFFCILLTPN